MYFRNGKFFLFFSALLVLSLLVFCSVTTAGEQPVKVEVDGKLLTFDVQPVIIEGRTLAPFRGILEAIGARVNWDSETRTVTAVKEELTIKLTIGSNIAYQNDKQIILDVPAQIIAGRTIVPVRFIGESLGAKVSWNEAARLVSINTGGGGLIKQIAEKEDGALEKIVKPTEEEAEKPKEEKPKETPLMGGGGGGGGGSRPAAPTEITITDSTGKKITVPQPLERVVALNSDIATAIKILGVQDRVVGISDDAGKREDLGMTAKEKVGKFNQPDLEKIVNLAPQVVFAYAKWPGGELEEKLEPLQIKVVRIDCYIPETLDADFRTVARMFGKEKSMEDFLKWKNDVIKLLASRTADLNPKLKVFAISSSKLAKGEWGTFGRGTATNEGIFMAGGINVAGELTGYPAVSPEWVLTQNPDVLLVSCYCGELGYMATDYTAAEKVKEAAANNEVLKQTEAVKKDRVYLLPNQLMGGVNTPFGALYLAKWLYPERFQDVNPENVIKDYIKGWLGTPYKGKWSYPPA